MRASNILAVTLVALLTAAVAFAPGCGDDDPTEPNPVAGQVPDFALLDVNPNSLSYSQVVSPRQHQGKVSAWYFGYAT